MSGAQAELAARLKQLHGITSEFHDLLQRESEQLAIWPLPDPWPLHTEKTVSYTHLTLPTICSV